LLRLAIAINYGKRFAGENSGRSSFEAARRPLNQRINYVSSSQ
jgi:hypothetical protein